MPEDPGAEPQPSDRRPPGRLVRAVNRGGTIHPDEPLDLPDGTPVQLVVPARSMASAAAGAAAAPGRMVWPALAAPLDRAGVVAELRWADMLALVAGLLLYALICSAPPSLAATPSF